MEEAKSLAKWWNNEVVMPSLSTSLYIVSKPGALPFLRNLTNLMRVGHQHQPQAHVHFRRRICSHLGPHEDKSICDYPR